MGAGGFSAGEDGVECIHIRWVSRVDLASCTSSRGADRHRFSATIGPLIKLLDPMQPVTCCHALQALKLLLEDTQCLQAFEQHRWGSILAAPTLSLRDERGWRGALPKARDFLLCVAALPSPPGC